MKKNLIFTLVAFVISIQLSALAQPGVSPYYQVPEPLSGRIVVIPAGTTFEGRIGSTIGSTTSKQGERFTITISSPVLANGSDVLIPSGAEVMGEVVQAVSAKQVPHKKKEKPPGKLRVQITALKMPDGMTYPMVASLVGEEAVVLNRNGGGYGGSAPKNPTLGSGIGYVGTQSGFGLVAPRAHMRNGYGGGNASPVVTKEELLNDPIMGRERDMDSDNNAAIRSLVKKNRELYIYTGSPLTIRLEAPFKMGMSSSAGEASALGVKPLQPEESSIPTQAPPSYPTTFGNVPMTNIPKRTHSPAAPSPPDTDLLTSPPQSGSTLPNMIPPLYQPPALHSNSANPSRSSNQDSNF